MLDLLTQIIQFIWELLPRPTIVGPMEEAACYWFVDGDEKKAPDSI